MLDINRSVRDVLSSNKVILWFIALFLSMTAAFLVIAPPILPPANGQDFIQFWLAGKMNWMGLNPYASQEWVYHRLLYGSGWVPDQVFNYPLPLYRFLAPLGLLPLYPAYLIWDILTLAYIALAVPLIFNHFKVTRLGPYIIPAVAGLLVFRPVIVTLRNGQISALIFFLAFIGSLLVSRYRPFWGGVIMGLCMFKPQIGFGIILFFSIWTLFNRNWSFVAGVAFCDLALLLIGLQADSTWIHTFLVESSSKVDAYAAYSPTFWGMSRFLFGNHETLGMIAAFLLCVLLSFFLLWILFRHRRNLSAFSAISLVVPVVLLVTPYVWAYDHFILLLPWLVLTAIMSGGGWAYLKVAAAIPAGSLTAIILLVIAVEMGHDGISMLLPLITFVWAVYVILRSRPGNS